VIEVTSDTEILLPLLAPDGFMLWHNYANWGRFNRFNYSNGGPEYIHELCARIPICQVDGTSLGVYCPLWTGASGREALTASLLREDTADTAKAP